MIVAAPHQIPSKRRHLGHSSLSSANPCLSVNSTHAHFTHAPSNISFIISHFWPLCRSFSLFCSADFFVFNTFWALFCKQGGMGVCTSFFLPSPTRVCLSFPCS